MEKETTYHFIGIGGIGMSALAHILLDKKLQVSGSDLTLSATVKALKERGATVQIGHAPEALPQSGTVVYSTDIKKENAELKAALDKKMEVIHRSELLARLMVGQKTLAIAGTHGKTTTTSLLAYVLMHAGMDPSYAIGGILQGLNGRSGAGEYFVAEADESDGSFLNYNPFGAICTNIEREHMDHYGTDERLVSAFEVFLSKVQGPLFYCGDDPLLQSIVTRGFSYGFKEGNQLRVARLRQEGWNILFDITFEGSEYRDIQVPLLGNHNALNAAAVFGLALYLGVPESALRAGLAAFPGVGRRCEKRGECREVLLIDDYAHHPTEIKTTLEGIREAIDERRLIALFQPHRYSRLKDLLEEFGSAFDFADHVYITDIYSAREAPIAGATPEALIDSIRRQSTVPVDYLPKERAVSHLTATLRPHDVLVTLGAGDITRLPGELMEAFAVTPPRKHVVGLLFGGKSCEHEISLRSCRFVNASLSRELYDVRLFAIDKQGEWIIGDEVEEILKTQAVVSSPNAQPMLSAEVVEALNCCDLFFPVLHGTYGEDGTLQGFFEMLGKPYAGPNYRSAAICMDKVLTKELVAYHGVPTPAYVAFSFWEWQKRRAELLEECSKLKFPFFVKPAHIGSSVGISKVYTVEELVKAVDYAFRYDMLLLVEEGKEGCRELEFAVMGNRKGKIKAPPPGEKLAEGTFVDYEKKYGQNAIKADIAPTLTPELLAKGRDYARRAYEATGNSGMTRVDFLLDNQGEFWFFEMNPIPGLQPLSLFPKIWNREGVVGEKLVDRLVILGIQRKLEQNRHLNTL